MHVATDDVTVASHELDYEYDYATVFGRLIEFDDIPEVSAEDGVSYMGGKRYFRVGPLVREPSGKITPSDPRDFVVASPEVNTVTYLWMTWREMDQWVPGGGSAVIGKGVKSVYRTEDGLTKSVLSFVPRDLSRSGHLFGITLSLMPGGETRYQHWLEQSLSAYAERVMSHRPTSSWGISY